MAPEYPAPQTAQITHGIDIFNADNPTSVISLCTEEIKYAIQLASNTDPEAFDIDERGLASHLLKKHSFKPGAFENRLRFAFWHAYDASVQSGLPIDIGTVARGLCTQSLFLKLLKRPEIASWILCPPANYESIAEETLLYGLEKMRDLLGADALAGGKVNVQLANLQLKIVQMLDYRIKGGVVQKQLIANVDATGGKLGGTNLADLQEQLERLEKQAGRSPNDFVEAEVVSGK